VLHHTEEGLRAADAGLALNPGSAILYHARGSAKNILGMFADGKSDTLHAIQLSPRDPNLGVFYSTLAASDIVSDISTMRSMTATELSRRDMGLG
jgi:hypothetical protein